MLTTLRRLPDLRPQVLEPTYRGVRPLFLVACVGRIMDVANTRKKEALDASVMRRSATSNLTPNFLKRTPPRQPS